MKERRYIAFYDFGEFEFYSSHRANSKANIEDAMAHAKWHYGYKRSKQIQIKYTQRSFNEM